MAHMFPLSLWHVSGHPAPSCFVYSRGSWVNIKVSQQRCTSARFMEARGEVLPSARRFTQMSKHRDAQEVNRNGRFLLICFFSAQTATLWSEPGLTATPFRRRLISSSRLLDWKHEAVLGCLKAGRSHHSDFHTWSPEREQHFGPHRVVFACCGHSLWPWMHRVDQMILFKAYLESRVGISPLPLVSVSCSLPPTCLPCVCPQAKDPGIHLASCRSPL